MNDWISLQATDLSPYLIEPQLTALKKLSEGKWGMAVLPSIFEDVVRCIRAYISGNGKNLLSRDEILIPTELRPVACHLAIEALQSRLPGLSLSAEQLRNAENARQQLLRISKGEIPVSRPVIPGDNFVYGSAAGVECVRARARRVNGSSLSGL